MSLLRHGAATYSRLIDRLPPWLELVAGAVCVVLGAVLVLNPFASLAVLLVMLAVALIINGLAELLRADRPRTAVLIAVALIAVGVLVLLLPGLSISGLTILVSIALLAAGIAHLVRAWRGESDQRTADVMLGLAAVVLGVLALLWRDITVFAIAALFGVRLLLFGIDRILTALRHGRGTTQPPHRRHRVRWLRTVGAAMALIVSVGLLLITDRLAGTPSVDDFYAAPADVPDDPGQLLRVEEFTRTIPDGATAWRILYTTTTSDDVAAIASALVVVPQSGQEHPVIAWAHGTTGFATPCAPSLLAQPFVAGAMPAFSQVLDRGWAVVATDYVGLGTDGVQPYLIGQAEGRSVLDAVRAAQQLDEADLGEQTVIWGHSQGGHAALWTGGLAATYTPKLTVSGVAAMAPAANLPALLDGLAGSVFGAIFGSFMLAAYAGTYPEVAIDDYVQPGARIPVESIQQRCLTDPATIVSVGTSILSDGSPWSRDPSAGALGQRAKQNVPNLLITAPLLIAQGEADTVINPEGQQDYVTQRCADGQVIDYRTFPGKDHLSVVADDSPLVPQLLTWTQARFDGEAASNTCPA